jgi:hypothetical protein
MAFHAAARYNCGEMKQMLSRVAIALGIVLLFVSCTSLSLESDEGGASYVVSLLNGKRSARLAAISASPFLVDGEIVALRDDVATFWEGIVQAELEVDPDLSRAVSVDTETWRMFGSTRDLQLFFRKPVDEGARLFDLVTADNRHMLVVYRVQEGKPLLYGCKGPF